MRIEANLAIVPRKEIPNSGMPSNVFSLQEARNKRDGLILFPSPTLPALTVISPDHKPASIIEFPSLKPSESVSSAKTDEADPIKQTQKEEVYNPSKKAREILLKDGKIYFRRRRASRCNGVHDAESDPCGSPRCKTKGRAKLNEKNQINRGQRRKSVILNGKKNK